MLLDCLPQLGLFFRREGRCKQMPEDAANDKEPVEEESLKGTDTTPLLLCELKQQI